MATDAEINALASQLQNQATPDSTPATVCQAQIASWDTGGTPPTVGIYLSGSTVEIPGVRYLDIYTPVVGDVVDVVRQGASVFVLGRLATAGSGWTQATLASGSVTHNGDSQGNLEYRLVSDAGSLKMQWRGAVAVTGGATTIISSGVLATGLRPSVQRKCLGARGMGNGNSNLNIQIAFATNGAVTIGGASYAIDMGYSDVRLSGYLSQAGSDLGHSHYLGTLSLPAPDWVSFNGVEYFL